MDLIKEAFNKVKEDIEELKNEIFSINLEIKELREQFDKNFSSEPNLNLGAKVPTNQHIIPTNQHIIPTDNFPIKTQKPQNMDISSGNEGVPTDRQTNQQTNQHILNSSLFKKNSLGDAINILNSLDSLKKEIRLKFKELTEQEFRVFSMIYQMDEEGGSNYKLLSKSLNLSESSVRDYVGKLIKKEIPVEKLKINNKNVHLSVSQSLKKIATLNTILQLREL